MSCRHHKGGETHEESARLRRGGRHRRRRHHCRARRRQQQRVQDGETVDARSGRGRRSGATAAHGRRHAVERLPVRGDPGRHLATHARPGPRRPVRQPRDVEGAVPVRHRRPNRGQRGERLRQRAGQQPDPEPALRGRAQRLVRDRQQLGLPALLLELSRDVTRGLLAADPLHERGDPRLRVPPRELVAAAPQQPRPERRRPRRGARHPDGKAPPDPGDGPAQPREQHPGARIRQAGAALG